MESGELVQHDGEQQGSGPGWRELTGIERSIRKQIGDESRRWKNVSMKLMGSDEELHFPLMQASTVHDVRVMIAEALDYDYARIELYEKMGCKFKRLRNSEEIPTKVLVKGITRFSRRKQEYPHPFVVIGAGHLGLRQAIHFTRMGQDFVLFERKSKIGGNAWNGIANKWSKLQSEGAHYHLNFDVFDGGVTTLMPMEKYSFWPTRDEILQHFDDVVTQFNLWPSMRMSTQVMDMEILPEAPGAPECTRTFRLRHLYVGDKFQKKQDVVTKALDDTANYKDEDFTDCSCITYYPGALAIPHRKTFPGEEFFGGQVAYGFNDEFDYDRVAHQCGIVIGMGAFAVENIRTLMEHNAKKFWVIARHHNLLLPRVLSWYVNQSRMPPTAACVLRSLEPIYKYYGRDPWSYFSVQTNADKSVASIKQYTRWGIGDVYFLGVFYGKVETIEAQVKRLKYRTAVLTNGRVLTDLDHVVKVLGFDGDFGVDRIMKTKVHIGFWPDGDYRRWICSDQSAIDASRFGGTAISPYAAACTYWPHHFFMHPADAKRLVDSKFFVENRPKPELGSPAYHYEPRVAATVQVTYSTAVPDIYKFTEVNDAFKKASMWAVSPPCKFLEECQKDWLHYCRKFYEFGDHREFPAYPYDVTFVYKLLEEEIEDYVKTSTRQQVFDKGTSEKIMKAVGALFQQKYDFVKLQEQGELTEEQKAQLALLDDKLHKVIITNDLPGLLSDLEGSQARIQPPPPPQWLLAPRTEESFEPARHVLHLRSSSPDYIRSSCPVARRMQDEWLGKANAVKDAILRSKLSTNALRQ